MKQASTSFQKDSRRKSTNFLTAVKRVFKHRLLSPTAVSVVVKTKWMMFRAASRFEKGNCLECDKGAFQPVSWLRNCWIHRDMAEFPGRGQRRYSPREREREKERQRRGNFHSGESQKMVEDTGLQSEKNLDCFVSL